MIVAGSASPLLLSSAGGYNLTNSLRFRSSASAYLNRTPASASNRQVWTWSGWVKRGALGVYSPLFIAGTTNGQQVGSLAFSSAGGVYDKLELNFGVQGTSTEFWLQTTQVFRDPSAWYHIVCAVDTTQATASNRVKFYVNGTQITALSSYGGYSQYPSQNYNTSVNNTVQHLISRDQVNTAGYFDGYLAEVNFIDGQALTPSSFGETSATTGVWIPKKYTGTYGTNGFYLPFTDTTSTSTLGTDFSGNSNTWTVNNISLTSGSTYDSMNDVPTLTSATTANYAVINPLKVSSNAATISSANLNVLFTSGSGQQTRRQGTIGVSTGKYYFEVLVNAVGGNYPAIGVMFSSTSDMNNYVGAEAGTFGYYSLGGVNGGGGGRTYSSYTANDVIGVAMDLTNSQLTFYKNGANAVTSGTTYESLTAGAEYVPAVSGFDNASFSINFGQRPFAYTPPTGFVALNTFNLPTPTIGATASTQAINYMGATTYSGDSTSNRVITTGGGSDFVWIKRRNSSTNNILFDVLRGAGATLYSNLTNAEAANGSYYVQTFGNTSFTLGTGGDAADNITGGTYVAWNWKANGAGSTNTAGSITSTVSANTTAGFSVVTYTGNGVDGATVGHGLGVTPKMAFVKRRNASENWNVKHASLNSNNVVFLNTTDAQQSPGSGYIGNLNSSSTLTLVNGGSGIANVNGNTETYVAYCFAEVAGYSAMGSYTGNGSTDGPFVFTGFRPRFFMTKCSSSTGDWHMTDTARYPTNSSTSMGYLDANTSAAEGNFNIYDGLSNGFKIRDNGSVVNASGATYIYMAFAENPFKYANAR